MSSNLVKICPACGAENSASLMGCFRCGESIIQIGYLDKVVEKNKNLASERNWFFEELLTPTFWVCVPVSILTAFAAIMSIGSFFMLPLLMLSVVLGGLPFMPGDPIGNYLTRRLEANARTDSDSVEK
jgi:hypothetical protein